MTRWRLVARSLVHFRASNLAVLAGVAVATAVLTGALVIGDSVNLSLRDLAAARLGPVQAVITSERFFDASLAQRLGAVDPDLPLGSPVGQRRWLTSLGPAILLTGSAADAAEAHRTAAVQIGALPDSLRALPAGRCIINRSLAESLGTGVGQDILLTVPRAAAAPAASPLARRAREEQLAHLRVTVSSVAGGPSLAADFSLFPTQRPSPRAWCNLDDLARAAGRPGWANTIFYGKRVSREAQGPPTTRPALMLGDVGLTLTPAGDALVLSSQAIYLPPAVEKALPAGTKTNRVLVNLVNEARVADAPDAAGRAIHYAVAAGLDEPPGGPLGEDELALNEWAARQLEASVGQSIMLSYYQRGSEGQLVEVVAPKPLRIARIVPMEGLGADPTLTPSVEGLTDADTMANWRAPQEWGIDPNKITPADEEYWKRYKAAPKLFLNLAAAQKLWGQSFGELTSIRFPAAAPADLAEEILSRLDLPAMGLNLRPLRQEQLAAAGNTEFAGLFAALSFFLIASALLLTALLMALAAEQRARQHGLLAALGMTGASIRRLAAAEGMLLAAAGALVGVPLSAAYTAAILAGLRTWWLPAVGTTALSLHVLPGTLALGAGLSLASALLAVLWGTWRAGRAPLAALLAGHRSLDPATAPRAKGRRGSIAAAAAMTLLAAALLICAAAGVLSAAWAPLAAGAAALAAALAWVNVLLRPHRPAQPRFVGPLALVRLAFGNAQRARTRSLLTVGLLALATFILVTAGALGLGPAADVRDRSSGAGGFALIARADIPLPASPASPEGRRLMRIGQTAGATLDKARFVALSGRAGDDLSCLNLNRPTQPTLLGVPPGALAGRFSFARRVTAADDPWSLLETPSSSAAGDRATPFIADDDTARYMLHIEPGQILPVQDSAGRRRNLQLVATLAGSIFQGELLVSQRGLEDLFPAQGGFTRLLVEVSPADEAATNQALTTSLGEYGLAVEPTGALLGRFAEVAKAYLSTFQLLGALGLLLGTLGLMVVLLRNLIARRAELMLFGAIGFSPARRLALVLAENVALLLAGLLSGVIASLLALAAGGRMHDLNVSQLVMMILLIVITGLIALTLAAWFTGRKIHPAQLGRE